jgi:hypothetical protein
MLAALAGCSSLSVGNAPQTDIITLDPCRYRLSSSARAVWRPGEPSPPVEAAREPDLRFPCPFTLYDKRTAWDRDLKVDLSASDKLRLKLRVADPGAVAYITMCLRSKAGWDRASLPAKSSFATDAHPGVKTTRSDGDSAEHFAHRKEEKLGECRNKQPKSGPEQKSGRHNEAEELLTAKMQSDIGCYID